MDLQRERAGLSRVPIDDDVVVPGVELDLDSALERRVRVVVAYCERAVSRKTWAGSSSDSANTASPPALDAHEPARSLTKPVVVPAKVPSRQIARGANSRSDGGTALISEVSRIELPSSW
jgi:hypothetical protein